MWLRPVRKFCCSRRSDPGKSEDCSLCVVSFQYIEHRSERRSANAQSSRKRLSSARSLACKRNALSRLNSSDLRPTCVVGSRVPRTSVLVATQRYDEAATAAWGSSVFTTCGRRQAVRARWRSGSTASCGGVGSSHAPARRSRCEEAVAWVRVEARMPSHRDCSSRQWHGTRLRMTRLIASL